MIEFGGHKFVPYNRPSKHKNHTVHVKTLSYASGKVTGRCTTCGDEIVMILDDIEGPLRKYVWDNLIKAK